MSISQDIRGALQARAATAALFPAAAHRAYEGVTYTPVVGTAWARMTVLPTSERPASIRGADSAKDRRGLFLVEVMEPATGTEGTALIEQRADAVKAAFPPGVRLRQGGTTVVVRYAERGQVLSEPSWDRIVVTVGWLCHSPVN